MMKLKDYLNRPGTALRLIAVAIATATLAACASMGRPQGGPRDENPPVFIRSNPAPAQLNVSGNKISITFDENVALDDPSTKVVVSPAQTNQPIVTANGHTVTVELRDTLIPNTTYTIDFADAIKDLNESNVLDGFSLDFSTGNELDSLRISGIVLEARTLEPAQGILVGVYSDMADSALTTRRFDRIAKTNQLGQFTIRNLKHGTYRIFAVNDMNRDYHWDRSEDVAFYDTTITPTAERIMVTDTLRGSDDTDSIVTGSATLYLPNDILLTWFNENYRAQYLVDAKRPERNIINIIMGAPSDTLPSLRPTSGPMAGRDISEWAVVSTSAQRDTLNYWITDSMVIKQDSLILAARYLRTDSLDQLTWTNDTLRMIIRPSKAKKEKDKKKESADSTETVPALEFRFAGQRTQELNLPMTFTTPVPLASIDSAGIRMEILVDTIWQPAEQPRLRLSSPENLLRYTADYNWVPDSKYRLTVDSAAIRDIYGLCNRKLETELTTRAENEYCKLILDITGLDGRPAIAELLQNDNPKKSVAVNGGRAVFDYIMPGAYYVRLFIDDNDNGVYDTGNIAASLQPEEVYYYPKKLNLKKNWDVTQTWDIYEVPLDLQKPFDIKKNKPRLKRGEQYQTDDEEEEEDTDGWANPWDDPYNRYQR